MRRRSATLGLAVLVLAGCSSAKPDAASTPVKPPAVASTTAPKPKPKPATKVETDPDGTAPKAAAADTTPIPVSLAVPAIGVTTSLQPLGLAKDGSLQSPSAWQRAGWYADGVRPGQTGPAVIAGHVDSAADGPAIFYRLKDLKVGDTAIVTRKDGKKLTFVVDSVAEYPKNKFPTAAVYGPTSLAVLRLVTCTGDFDAKAHSYVDNLVVTAHLETLFG